MRPPPPSSSPSPPRTGPTLDWEEALDLLRTMWLIHAFEDGAGELERGGEAVAAGVCRQLSDDDAVYCSRRAHGPALATGSELNATMAELLGRVDGLCKGLGGPAHLVDAEHGLMGGGDVALAAGSALAARLRGEDQVAVAFVDERTVRTTHVNEAVDLAALWELPVILVCESEDGSAADALAHHGLVTQSVDGGDAVAVWESFAPLLAYARAGRGPLLLECVVGTEAEPVAHFQRHGVAEGWFVDDDSSAIESESRTAVEAAVRFARESPLPPAGIAEGLTYAVAAADPVPDDPRVFALGKDELPDEAAQSAACAVAIGAALSGMRPVVDLPAGLAVPALEHAARAHALSGGQLSVPLVLRTEAGTEGRLAHVPGLKVVMPSRPADAAGLLASAIADPNPVVIVGDVAPSARDEDAAPVPLGSAMVLRPGTDVTIVALGTLVDAALAAAEQLAADGLDAEVIDPRTLVPLDLDTILESVRRTNRLVVVHAAVAQGGFGAEIAAQVQAAAFDELDAPIVRVGASFSAFPRVPGPDRRYGPR